MLENEIYRRAVYELQIFLTAARLKYPRIPSVKADGIYGPETRRAVETFQEIYGLPVTGEADQETWEAAREVYYQMLLNTSEVLVPVLLKVGEKIPAAGDPVYVIQVMLRAIGERYHQFAGVQITGILDAPTRNGLSMLWNVVDGLPDEDPEHTGPATVKLLAWLYNAVQEEKV